MQKVYAPATFKPLRQYQHTCVQHILEKASERFPQFSEHARFLSKEAGGITRFGGLVRSAFARSKAKKPNPSAEIFAEVTDESEMSRDEFAEMLRTIDLGLRALPATAQVRRQPPWRCSAADRTQAIGATQVLAVNRAAFSRAV